MLEERSRTANNGSRKVGDKVCVCTDQGWVIGGRKVLVYKP